MRGKIESVIIRLAQRIKKKRWDGMVYRHWNGRISRLSHAWGGVKLSRTQIRQLHDYWRRYTDIRCFEHEFYLKACGYFDVRFIPSYLHFTVIDKYFNDWDKARIVDNKTEYQRLFPNVKQPECIVQRCNGYWYRDSFIISQEEALNTIRANLPAFMKIAQESEGGHGVYYLGCDNTASNIQEIIDGIAKDIVVQKPIRQSPQLQRLNPSSVNTVRCLTFLDREGKSKLYSACLRMGIDGSKVDNASSGGVVAGIDEDGKLKQYAFKPTGEKFTSHPTSGVVFEGYAVPNFDKIKELVLRLATQYPDFRLISWDIALDYNNDPLLIEANLCSGELDFHQLNNGPLFGNDTEKILNEVFSNHKPR